ncbi:amino acid ABC transporter ATP-binding protein [Latilactobacillus graminis]|uniref:ABC transporter family protein n=2 Tax=Latilactobacillus graminis TaxID=60519 RepID=A0AA89KX25_9LACO|nr:ATP-binding cassette domain-containing protein [Latilactobacillus graminis]KRM22280.1 ABC transporter family protein [Latilactobacillus graminis DSM 20719]QFP79544.1 amino acid ABC transporter ATP-binding protein [Latilactobacillus graminis]
MFQLENINQSFKGRPILTDLNLSVESGSILAIVGPSGAGKSTLLRLMSGLDHPDSGRFLINGIPYEPSHRKQGARIGVVFQDFRLFPHLSVLKNVTLAPIMVKKQTAKAAKIAGVALLQQLGLSGQTAAYPFQLSGGQRQRVAIARALAMQPEILCYDEPTSALDPSLVANVAQLILDLKNQGMTQIVVTHDIQFANQIADQIFELQPKEVQKNDEA